MKRDFFFFFFLLVLFHSALNAQTDFWEYQIGPYGGLVKIYPTQNNVIYAISSDDLFFKSQDYGNTWVSLPVQVLEPEANIKKYYIGKSGHFYAAIYDIGIDTVTYHLYRSTDDGQTWELRNNPASLVEIWETPSGALFGYNINDEAHRSTDGGLTWQKTDDLPFLYPPFPSPVYYKTGISDTLILYHDYSPILYSLDDGVNWNTGGDWGEDLLNALELMPDGTLYLLDKHASPPVDHIKRSTDWGITWQEMPVNFGSGESPRSLTALPSGRLLLASSQRLLFSDDQGITWQELPSSAEKADEFVLNHTLLNGELLGRIKNTLFRSADGGATWTLSCSGMKIPSVLQVAFINDQTFFAVTQNGLWRTNNSGTSWTRLLANTGKFLFQNHQLALVNADSFAVVFDTIWKTVDGGNTFSPVAIPGTLEDPVIFSAPNGRLFTNNNFGAITSSDFGNTWQSTGLSFIKNLQTHISGILFGLFGSNTYYSTDGGLTWDLTPNIPSFIRDLFIRHNEVLAIDADAIIHRYDFATQSWNALPFDPFYELSGQIAVNDVGHIFGPLAIGSQIVTSPDFGESWYELPKHTQYKENYVSELEISPLGNLYVLTSRGGMFRSAQSTQVGGFIKGKVLADADGNCATADAVNLLGNWKVKIKGDYEYLVATSQTGMYSAFVPEGSYTVKAVAPNNAWWSICDSVQQVTVLNNAITDSINLTGTPLSLCPLVSVDVTTPFLRRCFDNPVYINYCNEGTVTADSAWIDLIVDDALILVGAEKPYIPLSNHTYRFFLGNLEPSVCGNFKITLYVDCATTVLGQTHCILAHAYPDTLCEPVAGWSGASIVANASCQDTVVQFNLTNQGSAPSTVLDFIIIEDDVVLYQGDKQYDPGETLTMEYPANGHTWRIESSQEPNHPFSTVVLAFEEGCGGFESLGFVNQFSVNGWRPSIDRFCIPNQGAYDPNDKQGFPNGYGPFHRIRPGQDLEYLIRFQNTGTDTAFNVVIRDTLSIWLDPESIAAGTSSHPYTWEVSAGVLTFRFDNILLPDSNVNYDASQGFVSFRIQQRGQVPLGTEIYNAAAIYFDFNEPVITNQTLHTVDIDYITAAKHGIQNNELLAILAQPNPADQQTLVILPEGTRFLTVTDVNGRTLQRHAVKQNTLLLERSGLPAGLYWLRAENGSGKLSGVGRVVWR